MCACGSDVDRVLVAGATGKTGRYVLDHLEGTPVTARGLTRSSGKRASLERDGASEVVVGDLLDPTDAARAVDGVDAVMSCVGSTPVEVYRSAELVDGTGNVNLIEAAAAADVRAFVMLSSLGASEDRGSWMARLFRTVVSPAVAAKTTAEATLRESGLRYTILRPGVLVTVPFGGARIADAGTGLRGVVSRWQVARLLAAAPFTPAARDRTVEIARNPLSPGAGHPDDWRAP